MSKWRSDASVKILSTEYSNDFDELRKDAMIASYHKYGAIGANYNSTNVDAIKSLEKRLKLYKETGNTEWLVDIANFAMIEFKYPQHINAHYKATDSRESPGVVGLTQKEIERLQEE